MAKKLWGGRFKRKLDPAFYRFQKSIQFDHTLAEFDVFHSLIHVAALAHTGVLSASEAKSLTSELERILKQVQSGSFVFNPDSEDIHTEIQNRLEKKLKNTALKLHTFRSRNEQIVFDETYYCYRHGRRIAGLLAQAAGSCRKLGGAYGKLFWPGYTHTRRAQAVRFAAYAGSFARMFERDASRIERYWRHLEIPTGTGAVAGSFITRQAYAQAIAGFKKSFPAERDCPISVSENPMDTVSDRDFIVELLADIAIAQTHLSRLAEDFILYSTKEFDLLDLPEEFCTGSSLMPHKKNPDFLELVRGATGRIHGNLASALVMMKSLVMTYNRDMQFDKEPLFSSVATIEEELSLMARFLPAVKVNEKHVARCLDDETLYATELAEFLVSTGMPFRQAHDTIGLMVRHAEEHGIRMSEITDGELQGFSSHLTRDLVKKITQASFAVTNKRSVDRGGR